MFMGKVISLAGRRAIAGARLGHPVDVEWLLDDTPETDRSWTEDEAVPWPDQAGAVAEAGGRRASSRRRSPGWSRWPSAGRVRSASRSTVTRRPSSWR